MRSEERVLLLNEKVFPELCFAALEAGDCLRPVCSFAVYHLLSHTAGPRCARLAPGWLLWFAADAALGNRA